MVLVNFSNTKSDVGIYKTRSRYTGGDFYCCVSCRSEGGRDVDMDTLRELQNHILIHIQKGHRVPGAFLARLAKGEW